MTAFADSSAVVKLYADEEDHKPIRALGALAVAQVCRVEVPAALRRKHRLGELGASDAQILSADFEADFYGAEGDVPRFAVLATAVEILDDAARLCASYGLRAYDAIQLASALAARSADPACDTVVAFDRSLRQAAAAEGFTILPADPAG